jgi:hypothetical protein
MGRLPKPVLVANIVEVGTSPVGSVEALRIVHIGADCGATHPLSDAAILLEGVVPRIQVPIRPLALLWSGVHAVRELTSVRHADAHGEIREMLATPLMVRLTPSLGGCVALAA